MANTPTIDDLFTEEDVLGFGQLPKNEVYYAKVDKFIIKGENADGFYILEVFKSDKTTPMGLYWAPSTFQSNCAKDSIDLECCFWIAVKNMKTSKAGRSYHNYRLKGTKDCCKKPNAQVSRR